MIVRTNIPSISRPVQTAIVCLIAVVLTAASGFAQRVKCDIKPEKLEWVLHAPPTDDMEPVDLSFTRVHNSEDDIWLRMGDLESITGRFELPSGCLEVNNGYVDVWQAIDWHSHLLVLDGNHTYNTIKIRPNAKAWGPSGIYAGELENPNSGISIPVTITIAQYAALQVQPEKIVITADLGPGTYPAAEAVKITVDANHPNWTVTLRTTGLIFTGKLVGRPADSLIITPDRLFAKGGAISGGRQSFAGDITLPGVGYPGTTYELSIEAEIGWEHYAGSYEGVIEVVLTQGDSAR